MISQHLMHQAGRSPQEIAAGVDHDIEELVCDPQSAWEMRNIAAVLFGKRGGEEITITEMETANSAILADLYTVWAGGSRILVNCASMSE
ncbi:hypothetical protein [Arthrobacter bambusae]|uniref:hypothetical protein n=1 Tax=Arthrobacter bambusae TaxID=1338426 RepID=UPI002780BD9E|nr:hypothetical protein [Arthrobacter bambusae]MDQ0030723.1 hypothetical protein [Arthrobacter bambusae]MDQ0098990.1 hypothetical protein [Arthrobacter bambusae]